MIPKDIIDDIFNAALIEDVVGDFVILKKRGANLLGVCPFHDEKTPSFTVSPAKGIYKCFGCGKGGNSVNFIMEHEQFSYPEALKHLAKKYQIEVPEIQLTQDQIDKSNAKESLYIVNSFANDFFQNQLSTNKGLSIAMSYFKERGINDNVIKKFQLGYSPDEWNALTERALKANYKKEYLEQTGLSIFKQEKTFDRFKGRIIFPIHSLSGRVLGFGGRTLSNNKKLAKYINSPESEIYHKSKNLYGLYFSKSAIIKQNTCYLVEGYTDVLAMHQCGLENVVASSGTALSIEQIKLINRYTKNIHILFDGDPAGIKASFRGIDLILSQGLNVKIILFPDGEDPDSYSKKVTPDEFGDFIKNEAKDFITFKTQLLKDEIGQDPTKKAALIKEIINSISVIPDHIGRAVFIKECSQLLEISEKILTEEIVRIKSSGQGSREIKKVNSKISNPSKSTKVDFNQSHHQERDIIRFLLSYGDKEISFFEESLNTSESQNTVQVLVSEFILQEISQELEFDHPIYAKILEEYISLRQKEQKPETKYFTQHKNIEISQMATDIISNQYELSENWKKHGIFTDTEDVHLKLAVENSVYSLKIKKIEQAIKAIQTEINSNNERQQNEALVKINKLLILKKMISKKLGRTILR